MTTPTIEDIRSYRSHKMSSQEEDDLEFLCVLFAERKN